MESCTQFLKWALPHLRLRWLGFRKVRNQVCKRINRRLKYLDLPTFGAYQKYLEKNSAEWKELDKMCRITISRFYRDKEVFHQLQNDILPQLIYRVQEGDEQRLRVWVIGSCSGEEAYTLKIIWEVGLDLSANSQLQLKIVATEADEQLISRAKIGKYQSGTLRELPDKFMKQAFDRENDLFVLKGTFKEDVRFLKQDIREEIPQGQFHLILCRNLVFTYHEESLQKDILHRILAKLESGGFLIIGKKESLPDAEAELQAWKKTGSIFRKK